MWEEISRGAEGRQPEMKYLLQHFEQDSLGGGGVMWMQGKEQERSRKPSAMFQAQ